MNKNVFETIIELPVDKRYKYFIKSVVNNGELWGLYHEGWIITEDEEGNLLIPVWPEKEFAKLCAIGYWKNYIPKKIKLDDFISNWIPLMIKQRNKPIIFWNNKDSAVTDVETLLEHINKEKDCKI